MILLPRVLLVTLVCISELRCVFGQNWKFVMNLG